MSSVSGRFLYQFGITAAVAVMVSLLVSFTLTPMMSARLLRSPKSNNNGNNGNTEEAPRSRGGFYRWLDEGVIEGTQLGSARYVSVVSLVRHLGPEAAKALGLIVTDVAVKPPEAA